jgi:riboflavin kinase/FMN adenylyltransferase
VADLIELGARYGFTTEGLPLAAPEDGAQPRFSSTDVRRMVLDGDVEAAARCLGRPHRVEGTVVHGAQRGREMGFPTANVETPPHTAIPADGVYAGWLVVGGRPLPAAISVGTNPTFDGTQRTVEAYAIGRTDLELYGEHVAVDFLARIRGQEKFDSMESLVKRMNQDVEEAQALLENTAG